MLSCYEFFPSNGSDWGASGVYDVKRNFACVYPNEGGKIKSGIKFDYFSCVRKMTREKSDDFSGDGSGRWASEDVLIEIQEADSSLKFLGFGKDSLTMSSLRLGFDIF